MGSWFSRPALPLDSLPEYHPVGGCTYLDKHYKRPTNNTGFFTNLAGYQIQFAYPQNGWDGDKETITRCGLQVGQYCTINEFTEYDWHRDLELKEFPNQLFNSSQFCFCGLEKHRKKTSE